LAQGYKGVITLEMPAWKIEWSDELSMSNSEIDAEHRHFIELVNELNSEIRGQRRDRAVVEQILNLILEDAIAHFSHEEQLFAKKSYPDRQEHTRIHSELISKFRQVLKEIQNTEFSHEWIKMGMAIRKLLINHVMYEDTRYIEYLRTE
jgi:hemerythrin-like metal-binding protein